ADYRTPPLHGAWDPDKLPPAFPPLPPNHRHPRLQRPRHHGEHGLGVGVMEGEPDHRHPDVRLAAPERREDDLRPIHREEVRAAPPVEAVGRTSAPAHDPL
ncbi:hypothetical protein, partial [Streptomyces sp. NPDC059742]|uniref:hypothetical protein n=1 Tax=Streptomyces sp. NPDC059742 TaxID=3346927 RepID=UPI003656A761